MNYFQIINSYSNAGQFMSVVLLILNCMHYSTPNSTRVSFNISNSIYNYILKQEGRPMSG